MMRLYLYIITLTPLLFSVALSSDDATVDDILNKMDYNMFSESQIVVSKMIVHGRR